MVLRVPLNVLLHADRSVLRRPRGPWVVRTVQSQNRNKIVGCIFLSPQLIQRHSQLPMRLGRQLLHDRILLASQECFQHRLSFGEYHFTFAGIFLAHGAASHNVKLHGGETVNVLGVSQPVSEEIDERLPYIIALVLVEKLDQRA